MKKIILSLVLLVIVAIAGGVYYVMSNLDGLIKEAIETYGSQATQTAVRVDSVKIKLADGSGGISGLTIANPKGFTFPNAFSLGETRLGIDLQSLQEEPYVINEIAVIAPEIYVEVDKDNNTNLNVLKDNLMASLPASEETASAETEETAAAEPRLIVRKVTFSNGLIKAKIAALDNKEYKLKLPSIEMIDLGGSKGLTPTELTSEVISRLSDHASKQVKQKIKDELKAKLDAKKAEIKAKLDAKQAEAEAKIEDAKAEVEAATDAKKEEVRTNAKDKLKGLFNR